MKIILIIIIFFIISGWDLPELIRKKKKKELTVYTILMAAGLVISILAVYHIQIPSATKGLTAIFKPFQPLLQAK